MPYVDTNSGRIFYADDDIADPSRAHDTVFMQPWLLGNHTRFRAWVPLFTAEFRVVRMDRRGFGSSDSPPLEWTPSLESTLNDFETVLDTMGVDQVHFVGESTGGLFGIAFAAMHPERVRSLVLCAAPTQLSSAARALTLEPYEDGATAVEALGSRAYAERLFDRASQYTSNLSELAERFEHVATREPTVIAAIVRMATDPDLDVSSLLCRIEAPTMLLTPGNSDVASLASQHDMLAAIRRCEQVVFDRASHMIFSDEPERCRDIALQFIRRHRERARAT